MMPNSNAEIRPLSMSTPCVYSILILLLASSSLVDSLRFSANGEAGRRLLRQAVVEVEPEVPRHLAQDGEEMNVGSMFIQYEGCSSYQDRGDDYYQYWTAQNQNNNNNNNNNNGNNKQYKRNNYYFQYDGGNRERRLEDYGRYNYGYNDNLEMVNLVRFTLCFDNGCSKCTGQYAIDMLTFLYAYNDHKQAELQLRCQSVKEQCVCDNSQYNSNQYYYNNNKDAQYYEQKCYKNCYKQAGLSSCSQFDENDNNNNNGQQNEQFQLNDYLACKQMGYYPSGYANYQRSNNNNQAGYYNDPSKNWENQIFYVGPYCKDASQIYLGAFMDGKCTYAATHATFSANYKTKNGQAFPYFQTPIVASKECISCQDEEQVYEQKMQGQYNYKNNGGSNQYMQRSYYYSNNNNQEQEQQQAETNELCAYVEEADEDTLISCVYSNRNNNNNNGQAQANYAGCSYLDMLPNLDGRNRKSIANANNQLGLQNSYTVILAVMGFVMLMTIAALTMCNPIGISEKKRKQQNLLAEEEIRSKPSSMGVEAVVD